MSTLRLIDTPSTPAHRLGRHRRRRRCRPRRRACQPAAARRARHHQQPQTPAHNPHAGIIYERRRPRFIAAGCAADAGRRIARTRQRRASARHDLDRRHQRSARPLEALPRFGGYVANLRRARADGGGGVVLVDAGDMFQGTLESNLTEGAAVVARVQRARLRRRRDRQPRVRLRPRRPARRSPRAPGRRSARRAQGARGRGAASRSWPRTSSTTRRGAPLKWPNMPAVDARRRRRREGRHHRRRHRVARRSPRCRRTSSA